ncbi:MAG: hypothetical protein WBE48_23390 [Xanthobacteraceae bacterium]
MFGDAAVAVDAAERIGRGLDEPDASGWVAMARGWLSWLGIGNSVTLPSVVMRPTRLPEASLNHSAPSRTAIDKGFAPGVMPSANSVIRPSGVMRAMRLTSVSENQTLPSGPSIMPSGPAFGVGSANSVISPRMVMRPILLALFCASHIAPSPPTVMPTGVAFGVGKANSRSVPRSGSKRPIFAAPLSQNHSAPSGPCMAM